MEDNQIKKAVEIIREGGIIVYPTDTIFGLGCDGTKKSAVAKIYRIKKREKNKSLSVIMADLKMIKKYCVINKEQEKMLKKYLPGPYTFLLKLKKPMPATNNKKIGIRIPYSKTILKICKLANTPIITTSANRSGQKNAARLSEVNKGVLSRADMVIPGKTKYKKASTIVDLVDNKIVRFGAGNFKFL